jgi:serine protease AprX
MRLSSFLIAALAVACLAAAPASAAKPRNMVLQYAAKPFAGKEKRAVLAKRAARIGLEVRGFEALPMLMVSGSKRELRRARRLDGVRAANRVDGKIELLLDKSVPLIYGGSAEPTWTAGYDGSGQTIAIVDSGIDGTHLDLIDQVTHNIEFAFNGDGLGVGLGGIVPVAVTEECPAPCNTDVFGHGTHVAGTAAGAGALPVDGVKGVAPGADLVGMAISQTGTTLEFYGLAAFDYILAHPELSIDVVNNSWQNPRDFFDPMDPLNQATKMLHDAGITVVFAAGNSYSGPGGEGRPEGSSVCTMEADADCKITIQSVAPWVMSVAAAARVFDGGFGAQRLADFSSRGDAIPQQVPGGMTIEYMPTITAPGTGIIGASSPTTAMSPATCTVIGDIPRCLDRTAVQNVFYTAPNGTSMASPHVAGAVAVIQSAAQGKLGRQLTPAEVERVITEGAAPMQGTDGSYDFCEWPVPPFDESECGLQEPGDGWTGTAYEEWQVGAGFLNVAGAIERIGTLTETRRKGRKPRG